MVCRIGNRLEKTPNRYKQSANFQIEQMARTVWLQEINLKTKRLPVFLTENVRAALVVATFWLLGCLVDGTWDSKDFPPTQDSSHHLHLPLESWVCGGCRSNTSIGFEDKVNMLDPSRIQQLPQALLQNQARQLTSWPWWFAVVDYTTQLHQDFKKPF